MKAMVITRFGGPEVFEERDVPRPSAGPGELLVRVMASSVNPVDTKIRQAGRWAQIEPPAILGYDVAGVVEEVGPGATEFKKGDEVFYSPLIFAKQGSYAEYHVTPERIVAKKPPHLSFVEAAVLPLAACTAWDALVLRAQLRPTETALIHAGAGGVGSVAVQIAKSCGARVIATASPNNFELVKSLGADVVIDRNQPLELKGETVDVAFDTVGGDVLARSVAMVRPGGRVASIVSTNGDLNAAYGKNITVHFVFFQRDKEKIEAVRVLAERGQLKPVIDCVMPFIDVAKAHQRIASGGMKGKIALTMS